jgi:hypothetical protein
LHELLWRELAVVRRLWLRRTALDETYFARERFLALAAQHLERARRFAHLRRHRYADARGPTYCRANRATAIRPLSRDGCATSLICSSRLARFDGTRWVAQSAVINVD